MDVAPKRPAVLIDECMPRSLGEFFAASGYTVYVVGALLPGGSPDASVVAAALDVGAIVVTTDSDFRHMKAAAEGYGGRLERADRIYFKRCDHVRARERIAELIDVIDREYRIAKQHGRKFFIQITKESYTIFRSSDLDCVAVLTVRIPTATLSVSSRRPGTLHSAEKEHRLEPVLQTPCI